MSWEAVTWAVKVLEHELHSDMETGPRFVLLIMANRANEEGELFPSVRWIIERTKYSERSVRTFIKEILHRGLMKKSPRTRDDGGQSSNTYQLAMDQYVLKLMVPGASGAGGAATVAPGGAPNAGEGVQSLQGAGAPAAPHETLRKRQEGKRPSLGGKPPGDELFETAWAKYPKRCGNNPKLDALKAWTARGREGVAAEVMIGGLSRYIAWVNATGKTGTEHVLRASTFFGPSKPYEQPFEVPGATRAAAQEQRDCDESGCEDDGKYPLGEKRYCAKHFSDHNAVAVQRRMEVEREGRKGDRGIAGIAASLVKPVV